MSVTKVFEDSQRVECGWFDVDGRRTAIFRFDELQLLAGSAQRHQLKKGL